MPTPDASVDEIMARLGAAFERRRDAERAAKMSRYMRDRFAFYGLPAPLQREAASEALDGSAPLRQGSVAELVDACWARDEREWQYFACGVLRAHAPALGVGIMRTVERAIRSRSWWDTVDTLAAHTVGAIAARHASLTGTMDRWIADDDMWIARTAILHQLTYKQATDAERLFRYCTAQAAHPDFFIRKAIGWALRQYAKTDPEAVRSYVTSNERRLSPVSVREALKNLP